MARHEVLLALGWAGLAGQTGGLLANCDSAMLYYKLAADTAAAEIGAVGAASVWHQPLIGL